MKEILDIVPAWTDVKADVQVIRDPIYIDKVFLQANDGDVITLYDGIGTTGKAFTIKQHFDDHTQLFDLGLVFNDGLYVNISDNTDHCIIKFRVLPG